MSGERTSIKKDDIDDKKVDSPGIEERKKKNDVSVNSGRLFIYLLVKFFQTGSIRQEEKPLIPQLDQASKNDIDDKKVERPGIEERKNKNDVSVDIEDFMEYYSHYTYRYIHYTESIHQEEKTFIPQRDQASKNLCIIINYTFKNDIKYKRKHYQKDLKKINEVISSLGDFDVEVLNDVSMTNLRSRIDGLISGVVDNNNNLILVILTTHGYQGNIRILESDISKDEFLGLFEVAFKREQLQKIFLLSYCQGSFTNFSQMKGDVPAMIHRDYINTLIGYSTLPGFQCYSNKDGDVFIQAWMNLVKLDFKDNKQIDAMDIQKRCECDLMDSEIFLNDDPEPKDQQPCHYSSLDRAILYNPGNQN